MLLISSCQNKQKHLEFLEIVNAELNESNIFMDSLRAESMYQFEMLYKDYPNSTNEFFDLAQLINNRSSENEEDIEYLKIFLGSYKLYDSSGFINPMKNDKNRQFIKDTNLSVKFYNELETLNKYFSSLPKQIMHLNKNVHHVPQISLVSESDNYNTWISNTFEGRCNLESNIQLQLIEQNIKSNGSLLITILYYSVGAYDLSFDRLVPIASLKSNCVGIGDTVDGLIQLVAFDSRSSFVVFLDGKKYKDEDGKIFIDLETNQIGHIKKYGYVLIPKGQLKNQVFPFSFDYIVK